MTHSLPASKRFGQFFPQLPPMIFPSGPGRRRGQIHAGVVEPILAVEAARAKNLTFLMDNRQGKPA